MYEQYHLLYGETSMERGRDFRDYALIHDLSTREFTTFLKQHLKPGDRVLDAGCGMGRAIYRMSKFLTPLGVECLALDRQLPIRRYPSVSYFNASFHQTGLEDQSVRFIMSVCGFLMYAEDEDDLQEQAAEFRRILTPNGEITAVVDPVVCSFRDQSRINHLRSEIYHLRQQEDPYFQRVIQEKYLQLNGLVTAKRLALLLQQRRVDQVWVQSPTAPWEYFQTSICQILEDQGLNIRLRILPRGGMMIDDEVTLVMTKTA